MLERMSVRAAALWLGLLSVGCARLLGADELSFDGPGGCSATSGGEECAEGGAADAPRECAQDEDCMPYSWSEPGVCRKGECVGLLDGAGCARVLGAENLRAGAPLFVFGIVGELLRPGDAQDQIYALALSELSNGGLELGGRAALPIAVVCDAFPTDDGLEKSIDHLVDTVGAPAIVASLGAVALQAAFERVHETKDKDVFFLSAFESDGRLETVDDDGLLWHVLPSLRQIAPAYLPLVRRVEDYVNPAPPEGERRPLRLALVESSGPAYAAVGAYLDEQLVFNGKPARENGPEHYLRLSSDAGSSVAEELERLTSFAADVVVLSGGEELTRRAMEVPEATRPPGQRGPFYVTSPQVTGAANFWQMMRNVPGLARRVVGVSTSTAEEPALSDAFLSKLASLTPSIDGRGGQNFYDAIYYTLYAAVAAGVAAEVTGPTMARGMLRLLEGPRFEVGVTDIPAAVAQLQSGTEGIALYGTLGAPTFDRATGARLGPGSAWCISTASGAPEARADALRYDPETRTLFGEFPCLEGF
jgi:hypothetical protein